MNAAAERELSKCRKCFCLMIVFFHLAFAFAGLAYSYAITPGERAFAILPAILFVIFLIGTFREAERALRHESRSNLLQ